MHPRRPVPDTLQRLAASQEGVVTFEQAAAHGLTATVLNRLCSDEHWQRLGRGVFLTTPGEPTWAALAWAGVLVAGDRARLGPAASAYLWQLAAMAPPVVDVLVPYPASCTVRGPWTFHREQPGQRSARTVGAPARLTAVDTVLDVAAGGTPGEVVDLVTRAVGQRLVTTGVLAAGLAQRTRHPRRTLLVKLLADVEEGVESPLELDYLRAVERAHGLPHGQRQRHRGGLRYRTDVGYDAYALLVELDGRLGHEGAGRFRDLWRDNEFALRSVLTLRYGWYDVVDRPCLVARQVAAVLQARGWPGPLTTCRHCRRLPVGSW